jgi:hypothetical protein
VTYSLLERCGWTSSLDQPQVGLDRVVVYPTSQQPSSCGDAEDLASGPVECILNLFAEGNAGMFHGERKRSRMHVGVGVRR